MRHVLALPVLICAAALSLSECSAQATCAVGCSAVFDLTVRSTSTAEPAVRFCDSEQCSPIATSGPVPEQLIDRSQERPALLIHRGHGEWEISPRGDESSPTTATVELYVDGRRIATRTMGTVP